MKIIETNIEKIISGINKTADMLCPTLGPFGTNVIIGRKYQKPIIANDSGTISDNLVFEDESEQIASEIINEATTTADKTTQDGRTSTVAIMRHLVNSLYKKTQGLQKEKPRKLYNKVREELETAQKLLLKEKKIVKKEEDLKSVALGSSQNKELAEIISNTFWKIGKDGVITIEDNFNPEISIVKKNGLEIPFKIVSDFLIKQLGQSPILVTTTKIDSINQIIQIYNEILERSKSQKLGVYNWVIIAPNFEDGVISEFKALGGAFDIMPIKIPESNIEIYEDISAICGTKTYKGQLELLTLSDIGELKEIVSNEKTIITGSVSPDEHIKSLKEKEIDSLYDKERLDKRIARLKNGIVVLKIGHSLDQDREFLKLKARDCVTSVKTALSDGYVKGAGVSLKNVADKMPKDSIIAESLKEPYRLIQESNGGPFEIPENVIDSYKTVEQEIITSCVLASNIINSHGSIADKTEKSEDPVI